ncbi:MAG TPA: energy transducer TonB [Chitinophagaceae bacterium]|nr:energy transducer TonB [Chitinophagaceae bacterium]
MKFRFISVLIILTPISFSISAQQRDRDSITMSVVDTLEQIFESVDIKASFPGGETAWRTFLEKNLRADVPLKHGAPAGAYTVWIQFIVDTKGNVSDLKPLTNHGYVMEAEIIRVLKKSPKWTPASQNGRAVKAYRKQPVTFEIEEVGRKRRH